MNAELLLFQGTGTGKAPEACGRHWPHLDGTGSLIQVPELECDLTSMGLKARPEADIVVRSIQERLGMTIGQVAKVLGCSRQAVHGWMRGRSVDARNLANLRRLAVCAGSWAGKAPSSLEWTEARLTGLAAAGLASEGGMALWISLVEELRSKQVRQGKLPNPSEIDRLLGRKADPLRESQRLSDNLRASRRDGA